MVSGAAASAREPRRRPLDRARVVGEAVALADEAGIAAVTMRAVADRLGVVPMALYKHVRDKADLVAGMVDDIVRGFSEPDVDLPWRAGVEHRITQARTALRRHAWLRDAVLASARQTPAVLHHMDRIAGHMLQAGMHADLVHYAMHALGPRIWGVTVEAFGGSPTEPLTNDDEIRAFSERYPSVARIATVTLARGGGCDDDDEFAFTLDLALTGIERLHAQGWAPRAR